MLCLCCARVRAACHVPTPPHKAASDMKDERDGMGTKNKGKGKGKGKGSGRDRVVWVVGPAFQSRSREWPTAHSPSPPQ